MMLVREDAGETTNVAPAAPLPAPAPLARRIDPPGAAAVLPPLPVPAWLPVAVDHAPEDVLSFLPPASVIPPAEELPEPPEPHPVSRPAPRRDIGAVAVSAVERPAPVIPLPDHGIPDWLTRIAAATPSAADAARIEERALSVLGELAAMTVPALIDRAAPVANRTAPAPAVAPVPFTSSPAFKVGVLAALLLITWKVAT